MLPQPRIPINEQDVNAVVKAFYARIRVDPELAPVFAAHVRDWPAHERRITGFWCNAILGKGGYDGNPMQVHRAAKDVQPGHFARWLAVFDQTLTDVLPPAAAMAWSALAARIGRGLSMGLQVSIQAGPRAGAPILFRV